MKTQFTNRGHITCHDLENAFLKFKRGSEDSFKLGLLYFVEFVIMDSLLFALGKEESDEENDGKGKGQKKGKKSVRSLVRKGKKNVEDEEPKRINRPRWSIKGLSYALQDGGVALSREQCVQNVKEEVQYTPPDINWDDPGVVCVTLIDMSTAEGECSEDVIVGVRQKRGRVKSNILGPTMKRRRAVVRETPWKGWEIPNISEDTIVDPRRPVPRDSLLEVAKFCWEWEQEENSHVRLCGEEGMEGSHNFFVRLLTNDSCIDVALLLLRERHKSSSKWVGSDWPILDTTFQKCAALDYMQMKAYVGKEDR
ncbi:unnamed protein product [Prunus brigantina]